MFEIEQSQQFLKLGSNIISINIKYLFGLTHYMFKSVVRFLSTGKIMGRGALVVFEGCDRCGKTTQCKKLVQSLNDDGIKTELIAFPDRSTAIGKVINDYLERKCELEDHAVHLLFTANRWELVPRMQKALAEGTTLVVDRYSYSGVAFSAAKENLDLSWCREPEKGLLKPDAVLYFTLSAEEAAKRSEFGGERYEETNFQKRVAQNYGVLKEDYWTVIDASKTIDELHGEVKAIVKDVIANVEDKAPAALWCEVAESANDVTSTLQPKLNNGVKRPDHVLSSGEQDDPASKKPKIDGIENGTECSSPAGDR